MSQESKKRKQGDSEDLGTIVVAIFQTQTGSVAVFQKPASQLTYTETCITQYLHQYQEANPSCADYSVEFRDLVMALISFETFYTNNAYAIGEESQAKVPKDATNVNKVAFYLAHMFAAISNNENDRLPSKVLEAAEKITNEAFCDGKPKRVLSDSWIETPEDSDVICYVDTKARIFFTTE